MKKNIAIALVALLLPTIVYAWGDTLFGDVFVKGTITSTGAVTIQTASPLVLEGATEDAYEATFSVTDPTADRTYTLQNNSGVVPLSTAGNTMFFTTTGATAVTLPTSGTVVSSASADTVTADMLADTLTLDADLTLTAGGGEQLIINKAATDATDDDGVEINFTALDTTSGTTAQYAMKVTNAASTEAADALYVADNADSDDNVGAAFRVLNPSRFTAAFDLIGAAVFGTAATTAWTFYSDGTGDGEYTVPAESISAGEITNPVRAIQLPLTGWYDCTSKGPISIDNGADAQPDIAVVQSGLVIAYDATGGSVDTNLLCTSFTVPPDYASGGAFVARITQGGNTVTNIETFSCDVSLDGAALVGANAANLTNQTAVQTATSTPVVSYAAAKSVAVLCGQGNASADDTVNIHSIEFQYTATM